MKYISRLILIVVLILVPTSLVRASGGPILPFYRGTSATYGSKGVHDCGFSLAGWKAVDLLPQQNQIYAAESGAISNVCRDEKQVSIRIGNNMYVHLKDTGQKAGDYYTIGQSLGEMVPGSYNAACGNTQQQPATYHLHFCFIPNGTSYQIDGYTLNTTTGVFSKGEATVSTGQALGSTWEGITTPTINSGMFNLFDWLLKGLINILKGLLYPLLPPGSSETSILNAIKFGSSVGNGIITVFELTIAALSTFSWIIPGIAFAWFMFNWFIQLAVSLYLFITGLIKNIPFL